MITFYRKYWRTALDIALIALTVFLIMWTFSFLYRIAAPIFLAFVVYWIIEPLARFLHRRKIRKSVATGISMLVFIIVIISLLSGAVVIFTIQVTNLLDKLPFYTRVLQEQIVIQTEYWENRIDALPPDLSENIKEYGTWIAGKAAVFVGWLLSKIVALVGSLSTFVLNFVIAIILAYFLSVEIETWKKAAREKTPNTFKSAFIFLRENVLKGITGYVKAQFKLILITFTVVFVALLALRVNNAFSISLLAAFFDLLPLLGVSTVFVPWIIYLFVVGETTLAFWLTGVLLFIILLRQILEPKITGDSLGVSAFTMLSFMIVSLSLFGVAGLIISPILIILIKSLYDQGYLQRWIRLPAEEYEPMDVNNP